jgi:hypothetical protein
MGRLNEKKSSLSSGSSWLGGGVICIFDIVTELFLASHIYKTTA